MLINQRNALMGGKRLPYDAEVEYLESTGTQWIDTGVKKVTTTTIDCLFSLTDTATSAVFGARRAQSGTERCVLFNLGTSFRFDALNQLSFNIAPNTTSIFRFEYDGSNATITDTTTGRVVSGAVNIGTDGAMDIALFACNTNGTVGNYLKGRIYSFKIWDNGVLVHDFIPVRKGTTGELYDRVSGKFAERHGDFVLGPDVVPVEYIESHGTEWIDTGVIPVHHETKIKFSTPTPPPSGYMCGSFTANNRYYPVAFLNRNITIINAVNTTVASYGNDGNPHTIVYNSNEGSCYFDGVAAGVLAQTSLTTNNPIYFFGTSTSTGPSGMVAGRLYETELKDNSIDSLVRKFRPVRVGTEGALIDTLTRRIYRNAGTGAFTYGNDLKYPIPAE